MNILPKKRWHVRTKDNIARVRRDEAAAQEEELKKQAKLELAESEARINFLRKQAGVPSATDEAPSNSIPVNEGVTSSGQHIDLFADYKSHIKTTNKELEKEKKEEQEKYEKQIGYLTYLGQDTNEALKQRSWYEKAPERGIVGDVNVIEKDLKTKYAQDPLTLINSLIPPDKRTTFAVQKKVSRNVSDIITPIVEFDLKDSEDTHKKAHKNKKYKKHKHHKKEKKEKRYEKSNSKGKLEQEQKRQMVEKLRTDRLRREAIERARQDALLAPKVPEVEIKDPKATATPRIVQKYNSQFNPELAKQNML